MNDMAGDFEKALKKMKERAKPWRRVSF